MEEIGGQASWPPGRGSQVSGWSPVIAVFIRGLHISGSCKLFPQSFPLICPGDQKIEEAVGGEGVDFLLLTELTLG